jgi:hypothetical protein
MLVMNLRLLGSMLLLVSVLGCADSRTFNVSLKNDTSLPIVAWITKTGGPYEPLWRSPEDYAIERPGGAKDQTTGVYVQPGERIGPTKITGQFDKGVAAVLRVYLNPRSINDVLAIGPNSPNRVDVQLEPGVNQFIASNANGKLVVARQEASSTAR